MGRDSSVDIATRYGLDGPGSESRWGATFAAPVQTGRGTHPASCTVGIGLFPGVKQLGGGASHPTPPSPAEANEGVGLYLYSPLGLNVLYRVPFTFYPIFHLVDCNNRLSKSVGGCLSKRRAVGDMLA
jgi:hypothetical protein